MLGAARAPARAAARAAAATATNLPAANLVTCLDIL